MAEQLRTAYGRLLAMLGEENDNFVVFVADTASGTGTESFVKKFPQRSFDVGIAEQNLMSIAAGFSTVGIIPFVNTYGVFSSSRVADQIRNSICYPNLNVKIVASHVGLDAGSDGASHILVNNAGVNFPTPILDIKEETWDRVMAVNLKGVFLCSQAVARIMVESQSGKIINIASVAGKTGAPGLGPYCASKRGVIGLTEVLAIELGVHGICVNAVCPGNFETDMIKNVLNKRARERGQTLAEVSQTIKDKTPLGRFGYPQDIGELVVFLASSHSDYITGQAINICGGRSINLS